MALASALIIAGLVTQLTALIPVRVGNVDWEFGALGEAAATGPLMVMGVAAALFVATRTRSRRVLVGLASLSLLWALVLVVGLVLLALDVPLVLAAARNMTPEAARSVKVVLVKSGGLLGIEALALFGLGIQGVRWWRGIRGSTGHGESGT